MATLYINSYKLDARLSNGRVEVKSKDEDENSEKLSVPFFDLDRVVVIGNPYLSMPLLHKLMREEIPLALLSGKGNYHGSWYPFKNGNALRRVRQYQLANNSDFQLRIAVSLIKAKLFNSRRLLQRLATSRGQQRHPAVTDTLETLQRAIRSAESAGNSEELRGIEGRAASVYFSLLATFFPSELPFKNRSRRPPDDPANALLSWTYTIVTTEIDGLVRAHGLDPLFGVYHELNYNRSSLTLDLLEPMRPALCDALVLKLLNLKMIQAQHFEVSPDDGGTYLTEEGRKRFFPEYEKNMQRRFAPERGKPHVTFRKAIRAQILDYIKAIHTDTTPIFFQMP